MSRLRTLPEPDYLPALDPAYLSLTPAVGLGPNDHPPRILLLYGPLRQRSFSRLCVEEAARLLRLMGCETRIFDPSDLPLPGSPGDDEHPAVKELREHAFWSEGMVWCSPELHGQVSGLMKLQIDHLPLSIGGVRPTQGRTLAVMLAALLALATFLAIERQVAAPLMPLTMLRMRGLQHAMLLTLLFMSCYGVQYYFLGLYFQQVLGWSPLQAGLAFVLPTIACAVGIRCAERGLARHSARFVLMGGWAAGLAGLVWTAAVLPLAGNYWWLVPGFIVMSIGQGASWTGMWVLVGEGIEPQQQGVASGVAATAQQVGAALGLAVLVMVAARPVAQLQATGSASAQALQQANAQGLQNAEWGTALIALLAVLVCAAMGRRPPVQVLKPQAG